jgi:mRNA interferase MazF
VICNQWDVALVPFPFMEMPASKKRPALVISSQPFNDANGHTIFAMITTAKASTWASDYLLASPQSAGLTRDCYVRWKTFTLPNDMILRRLGRLAQEDCGSIKAQLGTILGLTQAVT